MLQAVVGPLEVFGGSGGRGGGGVGGSGREVGLRDENEK